MAGHQSPRFLNIIGQAVVIACLFFSGPVLSKTPKATKKPSLMQPQVATPVPVSALKEVLDDPDAYSAAVKEGAELSQACTKCHGVDGVSPELEQFTLTGQNPVYLLKQIDRYATGERRGPLMQRIFENMSAKDRINIAVYYSSLKRTDAASTFLSPGKELYEAQCATCHGENALGNESTPRLAGQHAEFINQAVARYRDKAGPRIDPLMAASIVNLKELQIRAIALYLTGLR